MNHDPNKNQRYDDEGAISTKKPVFSLPPYQVQEVFTSSTQTIDWGLEMLNIPSLWRYTRGQGVRVAVLDTGISMDHPDLIDAIEDVKDFTGSSGPNDQKGHGTHVAGIIAARDNNFGVVGVAPEARLLVGKVLGDDGFGTAESIAAGIEWAITKQADILCMSLGSSVSFPLVEQALMKAHQAGIVVICAAGNAGPSQGTVEYPARYSFTLAVGSIDRTKKISRFSSRGEQVDIVAPGDNILSTYPMRSMAQLSGTSMATPFVVGVVALLMAKHRMREGGTPLWQGAKAGEDIFDNIKKHLEFTAMDLGPEGFDSSYGFGLINPGDLLRASRPPLELNRRDFSKKAWTELQQYLEQHNGCQHQMQQLLARMTNGSGYEVGSLRIRL